MTTTNKKTSEVEWRAIPGFPGYAMTASGSVRTPNGYILKHSVVRGSARVQLNSQTSSGKTSRLITELLRETWGEDAAVAFRKTLPPATPTTNRGIDLRDRDQGGNAAYREHTYPEL